MMKRFLSAVLLLALALSWLAPAASADTSMLRGWDKTGGYVYLTLGSYRFDEDGTARPIIWRVLEVKDGLAYAVSEYVLINHRIHDDDQPWIESGGDFKITEMYDFLNGEFRQEAFTDAEWNCLVETPDWGSLFLLSRQDLKNKNYGFTNDQSRKAWGTPWALAQMTVNEKYNRTEQALFRYSADRGSHSPYWTRTQGSNKYSANCTKSKGEIGWIRVVVQNEGCRPACYIDLEKIDITGGAGTLENPYEAVPVA